ncbi:MAG: hypothetical protein JRJ47_13440, partial [Deltaproteobacteria bacterium]|nr:hypothetical protein [Deltaproteobacteria bacterium]
MKTDSTNHLGLGKMAVLAAICTIFLSWGVASAAVFHHADDCTVCHDMSGATSNLGLIAPSIDTDQTDSINKRGVVGPVVFTPDPPEEWTDQVVADSYADGDELNLDGVCEVCHTDTNYHTGDADDNREHYDGENCFRTDCHASHCDEFK